MTDDETDDVDAEDVENGGVHLAELADGAGCAEIWEHMSRRRNEDDD